MNSHLSLRQLVTFREVMRSGSISQAADTLGRTQPAVSTLIRKLEAQLGFALFTREQGKLTATPEAHFFLEECDDIVSRVERAEHTLGRIRTLQAGRLKVGCHPAASSVFLPRLLTSFLEGRDELEVSLIMRSSDLIEDLIASRQFDVGFAETPTPRASVQQIDYDLQCVCLLRADDPLAQQSIIGPHDLDGRPMGVLFAEHETARQTEAAFGAAGCRLNKRLELRTFKPGLPFVSSGACVLVCDMITAYSHWVHEAERNTLVIRRFRPRISNRVSILTPGYATGSIVARAFIECLREAVEQMQAEVEDLLDSECCR